MLHLTTVADVPVALGMDWIRLTGEHKERAAQRRTHLAALGARHSLTRQGPAGVAFGAADAAGERIAAKTVSGAAWLAKAIGPSRNVVLMKDLGAGLVWICAIHRGLPLARGDRVVKAEAVADVIDELAMTHDRGEFSFVFDEQTPGSLAALHGDQPEPNLVPLTTLLKEAPAASCQLEVRRWTPALTGLVALVVCACVAAGVVWLVRYEQQREAERSRNAAPPPKPEEAYARDFARYYASSPRYPAKQLAVYLYERIRKQDAIQNGWKFVRASCDGGKRACVAEFKRSAFAQGMPWRSDQTYAIEQSMDAVLVRFPLDLPALAVPDAAKPSALPAAFPVSVFSERILPLFRDWHDLGLQTRVDAPAAIPALRAIASPLIVTEGKWQVFGPMSWFDLLDSLPPGLAAATVEIVFRDGQPTFAIGGSYWTAEWKGAPATSTQIPYSQHSAR